jgi:apolipoprotein N-acyltransferase
VIAALARRTAAQPWLRLVALALCGVAAAAGQVPWSLWPVALAGYAGGIALVAAARGAKAAALSAWVFGAAHFALALHWIVEPFLVDPERNGWMAPFALVLMAGGLALFWGLAGAITGWLRAGALGFALALAGTEALRAHVLTGFPWAMPGHVWIGLPPVQFAALGGALALGLVTLVLAALPAAAGRAGAAAAVAGVAVLWAGGSWREALPLPAPPGPVVRVVQPNAAQALKWDPVWAERFFERQLAATAALPRPDLVVWPETAVDFLLNRPGEALDRIAEAAAGVPVAFGAQRTVGWRGYNSLALLGTGGGLIAVYDKHHLVPFGEYIPAGDFLYDRFGIAAFAAQVGQGYSAGHGPRLMAVPGVGMAQPLICYEAVFPRLIRRAEGGRADFLLQATNDAWFGRRAGPFQHLALARLRAVEFGLPVVRAANTGVSAVIDARGGIVTALPLDTAGHADAPLPAALAPTPYARSGEVPFLLLLGLGAGLRMWQRRRSRSGARP